MKASTNNLFLKITSVILSIIAVLSFILTLLTAYIHFTVYDKNEFVENVGYSINTEFIKQEAIEKVTVVSNAYGFEATIISNLLDNINFKELSSKYFSVLYEAFLNGDTVLPVPDFESDSFLETIAKEFLLSSLRPELYEIEENRTMLADKYNDVIKLVISALSLDSVGETLTLVRSYYLIVLSLGQYFIPLLSVFAACMLILLIIFIIKKQTGSLYTLFLSLFTVSLLFTVPLGYLSAENLVARFNVNLGAGYAYIEAIWNVLITDAAKVYAQVSLGLLILLLITIIVHVFTKKKQ